MSESQYVFLLFFGRKINYFLLNNKFTKVKFLELTRVRIRNILKAHIPLSTRKFQHIVLAN